MDRLDVRAAAAQVRGRDPADRRGGRARRGGGLPDRARAWTRSPRTSRRSPRTRWSGCARVAGLRVIGPDTPSRPRRRGRASPSRASTRTTSARCWTSSGIAVRAGHHCARPVCAAVRNPGDHAGVLLPVHDAGRGRRAGRRPGARSEGRSDRMDCVKLESHVPGDHPGPLQAPARTGLREPYDAEVHHVNPTCGDEVTLRVQAGRRGGRGRLLRRRRAARSARPRLRDDRPGHRQAGDGGDRGAGGRSCG